MVQETGVQSQDVIIPKTQKMVLDTSLFNILHYKVWIKNKWGYLWKEIAVFSTLLFSSF